MGILLGILAASVWGVAGVAGGLGSRIVGPMRAIGWAMLLGMIIAVPLAFASGAPGRVDARTGLWVLLISACMLGGLACVYAGMRYGSISVVAPISATYGGVAALIAILAGDPVTGLAIGALSLAVVGAVLASRGETATPGAAYSNQRVAALLGAGAALLWGVQLWAGGQIQDDLGASWLVASARMIGVLVITVPLLVRGQLRVERKALPYLLVAGVGEVCGFTLYLIDSGYGIAQAAVLTGQYGTVAALIGIFVLKERLQFTQVVGLILIVLAVIGLSLA
ncbi:MAG: DMT family transporter [Thermoleophilia bacterium]